VAAARSPGRARSVPLRAASTRAGVQPTAVTWPWMRHAVASRSTREQFAELWGIPLRDPRDRVVLATSAVPHAASVHIATKVHVSRDLAAAVQTISSFIPATSSKEL
jgi:hypothetical protein